MVWSKIDFAEELADRDRADCFRASVDTSALGREARELAADWGRRRPLSAELALLRDSWLRREAALSGRRVALLEEAKDAATSAVRRLWDDSAD